MLEGLEVSEVFFSHSVLNLKYNGRCEAEFFLKNDKILLEKIYNKNYKELGDFVFLTDGEHGNAVTTPTGYAKYYGARNVLNGILNDNSVEYISKEHHDRIKKSKLFPNDILVSCVGANIGFAAIVPKNINEANIVRNVALIRSNNTLVLNQYILAYFLSKYGKKLFIRMSTGNAQPLVSLDYIKTIPVFIPLMVFQNEILKIVDLSIEKLNLSKNVYTQAEQILLQEIGLQNFEPSKEAVNIKSFKESFGATKRLDAEYYQAKYDDLENVILSQSHTKIKDIRIDNFRGLQPIYDENGNLDIINSKHILETSLDYDNFEKTNIKYWDIQERARVFKGDILTYTTGANIGRTQVYLKEEKALASNHVNIIRLKEGNPIYIGFVLNSLIGRLQTEKRSAGSAQAELYPKDLDEFLIPIIAIKVQKQIAELIQESFQLKAESEKLLEVAKKAVEIAIENGEELAMEYIEKSK